MSDLEFPVSRLYAEPKANGTDNDVMIAPLNNVGGCLFQGDAYMPLPTQTTFRQAMSGVAPDARRQDEPLDPITKSFIAMAQGSCSFFVVSNSMPKQPFIVHVGELVSVGALLTSYFPERSVRFSDRSREAQEARRLNDYRYLLIRAAQEYHRDPRTGEVPHIETLYNQPAVVRIDNSVVLPKATDLIATPDGDVVMQINKSHVEAKTEAFTFQVAAREPQGCIRVCSKWADLPGVRHG